MTEKQAERVKQKIKKIKSALAADKKRWGGFYDDSRGLRYLPLEQYIKLKDYSGGNRYINWFYKNFPDDSGFPDFTFECAIILFYSGKLKEAQKKLFETYMSNTYLIDKFLENDVIQIEKQERSNISGIAYLNYFNYSCTNLELSDFTSWVKEVVNTELFKTSAEEFIQLQQQLLTEREYEKRVPIVNNQSKLLDRF
jgi:hypothetical protein